MYIKKVIGNNCVELMVGDISEQWIDAIVTAANSRLIGGGGVDGAIHKAAGPELLEVCKEIGGCGIGSAVCTPSFKLSKHGVKKIIHAVGPIWWGGKLYEEEFLRGAYQKSLELAEKEGCRSIAFPAISTGVYEYPVEQAAEISLRTVIEYLEKSIVVSHIRFVLFEKEIFETFAKTLIQLMEKQAI
jgi:O-acetyl-ADP-ribose deacetylase (regulator of RNase III)